MNRIKYLFLLVGMGLLMASCSPFRVVSDYDPKANFSEYKTYSVNLEELKLNDIDQSRVTEELQKQLAEKGLSQSNEAVDLVIQVKANHKLVRDTYVTPNVYLGGWGSWLGWGMGLGRTYTNEYNQGGLVFNFMDAKTGKLVWQGKGSGINVDSPKSKQKQIPEIIAEILKNYPPKK